MDCETFDILGRWEIDRGPQKLHYDFWWNLPRDYMVSSEWGLPCWVHHRLSGSSRMMTQSTIRKTLAAPALAAGFSLIEVPSDAGPGLAGGVWYPCATPPGEIAVGPVMVRAAKDCPIAGRDLPLVVISHGFGGSFVGHRDVAEALADAGFIVAAINHPSDSSRSPEHDHKDPLSALTDRPADIKHLVDFMLGAWPSAAKIDRDRIGFFGFSRGGFTGLALIGGEINFRDVLAQWCPEGSMQVSAQDAHARQARTDKASIGLCQTKCRRRLCPW